MGEAINTELKARDTKLVVQKTHLGRIIVSLRHSNIELKEVAGQCEQRKTALENEKSVLAEILTQHSIFERDLAARIVSGRMEKQTMNETYRDCYNSILSMQSKAWMVHG